MTSPAANEIRRLINAGNTPIYKITEMEKNFFDHHPLTKVTQEAGEGGRKVLDAVATWLGHVGDGSLAEEINEILKKYGEGSVHASTALTQIARLTDPNREID